MSQRSSNRPAALCVHIYRLLKGVWKKDQDYQSFYDFGGTTYPHLLIFPASHAHSVWSQRPRVRRTRLTLVARSIRLDSRLFTPPCPERAPTVNPKLIAPHPLVPVPVLCYHYPRVPDSTDNMKDVQHETLECNIRMKQMKHLEYILATYVWNICSIQIKHLQLATWKRLLQHKTENS
jgi:hypothetical protein